MQLSNMTQTVTAPKMGEYKPTTLDARKAQVDFLVTQVGPFYIRWANGTGEQVTAARLKKLQAKHTWATDF